MVAVVDGEVTAGAVNTAMEKAANESFGCIYEPIVSGDVIGMRYGSLCDLTQTMTMPLGNGQTHVQVVAWYDNENSYTSQMVRTIKHLAEMV